ncbi:MAG: heavy-metal-associated domain-containing protein [Armatimonadota bacterium]|nr:heavy-metal-associated domain-containing protein [Armatimonadota bacterium]
MFLRNRLSLSLAVAMAVLILAVVVWFSPSIGRAYAQCSMPGMSHGGDGDQGSHVGTAGGEKRELKVTGTVLAINAKTRTVSLRLDVPLGVEVGADQIRKTKVGDTVTAIMTAGAKGRIILQKLVAGAADASPAGNLQTVKFKITGLMCGACADKLQESLKSAPGVATASVSVNPAEAKITFDPAKTDASTLKKAVAETEPIHEGHPFGVRE